MYRNSDDDTYIDCYVVASHGRVPTPRWMQHTRAASSSSISLSRGDDVATVMMQLVRDVLFAQVDSVPSSYLSSSVCQPPQSCLKFVVASSVNAAVETTDESRWQTTSTDKLPELSTVQSSYSGTSPLFQSEPSHLTVAGSETDGIKSTCNTAICPPEITSSSSSSSSSTHDDDMTPDTLRLSEVDHGTSVSDCFTESLVDSSDCIDQHTASADFVMDEHHLDCSDGTTTDEESLFSGVGNQTHHQAECSKGHGIERLYSLIRKKKTDQSSEVRTGDGETVLGKLDQDTLPDKDIVDSMLQMTSDDVRDNDLLCGSVHTPSFLSSSMKTPSVNAAKGEAGNDCLPRTRLLARDSLLLVQHAPTTDDLNSCSETLLAYDSHGSAFYVPATDLRLYGDPEGEPWFFPVPLTPLQATVLLPRQLVDGSFVVYREFPRKNTAEYCLSVRAGMDVLHYSIVRNMHGDLSVAGHSHSFLTLSDLVSYFQHNKSSLATRLSQSLSDSLLPISTNCDIASHELNRSQLRLSGSIIANGRFGLVCSGQYQHLPVAIEVIEHSVACFVFLPWNSCFI